MQTNHSLRVLDQLIMRRQCFSSTYDTAYSQQFMEPRRKEGHILKDEEVSLQHCLINQITLNQRRLS